MTDPQKDEHIEELLSKLQGIFGKLSHSEEDDMRQKDPLPVPLPRPPEPQQVATSAPTAPPAPIHIPMPAPSLEPPSHEPLTPEPPAPEPPPVESAPASADLEPMPPPMSFMPPFTDPPPAAPPEESPRPPDAPAAPSLYETTVPTEDPEKMIVPTAVFFPPGRESEAKTVAQKLETMAPKFTKVAFRLRVGVFMPYDQRTEWKETIIAKAAEAKFQAVFVLMDRALDDTKRKMIAGDLESRGIYMQEVLTISIEKKAFYTDVLLGLVFFFDSRKPNPDDEPKAP